MQFDNIFLRNLTIEFYFVAPLSLPCLSLTTHSTNTAREDQFSYFSTPWSNGRRKASFWRGNSRNYCSHKREVSYNLILFHNLYSIFEGEKKFSKNIPFDADRTYRIFFHSLTTKSRIFVAVS